MKPFTVEDFIRKATEVHKGKYIYTLVKYINNKTDVCIICPEHGEFWQRPSNHLNGRGCPKCGIINNVNALKSTECFIEQSNVVHGNRYKYHNTEYKNNYTKICITCPIHGDFWQMPYVHLRGSGCPKCGRNASIKTQKREQTEYIQKCNIVHKYKYTYHKTKYINAKSKICITCPIHGDFWQLADNHLCGHGCPLCGNIMSTKEAEIYEFCKTIDKDTELRNREILSNKEIDVYCPSEKIGIEYDGLYWHSEQFKEDPVYCHLNKSDLADKKGVKLIHLFEDEWIKHSDVVKSRLRKMLKAKDVVKINADDCVLKKVQYKEANDFLKSNDIQNKCKAKYYFGLFFRNNLVLIMSIGYNSKKDIYTILNLCEALNISVINGTHKLLSYFINSLNPSKVIAYADKRWCESKEYLSLGFTYVETLSPDYYYVIGNNRENKSKYTKNKLIENSFDKNKTVHQIMMERGIYRIYDCGKDKFEMLL